MEVDAKSFKPIGKYCLVRRDKPEEESGGIIIPDNVKTFGWNATVLKVGNKVSRELHEGERVLFLKEYTVLPFNDRTLAVTDGEKIIAKIIDDVIYEEIHPIRSYILIEPEYSTYEKDGIYLPDKSVEHANSGTIVRIGSDCKVAQEFKTAYYISSLAVKCVENDEIYHLIDESELLCIRG